MDRKLIADMNCPYCAGTFHIAKDCRGDAQRIRYGVLECRCFQFPIVDGVLLLSLSKAYGGAEEDLQPYVPLQVAAIRHLQKDDVPGLLSWMRRHMPLAAELIDGRAGAYLPFCARMNQALTIAEARYLAESARHEVLGHRPRLYGVRKWARRFNLRKTPLGAVLNSYFISRFFAPRVNTLAMQLGQLPLDGRILSLCCGQGIFENLLAADGRNREVVCLDGQFINLLITRQYVCPQGSFICHDVQFPLPFNDGSFDGVFSSTCLPEIPAQRTFAREAIRVTRDSGWTFFDSVWGLANSVKRIDPKRHYRFCQNFFTRIEDYLPFFESCAPAGREVAIDIPAMPDAYYGAPRWLRGEARAAAVAEGKDTEISVLVTDPQRFRGFTTPHRPWLNARHLAVSPVFETTREAGGIRVTLRPSFAKTSIDFAAKSFAGYPQTALLETAKAQDPQWVEQQFNTGMLALLPTHFDEVLQRLQ
ncbi:MAG: class I SAM-dependent methyltransferase [Nevskiaceae bacterium]|nr:MAG: class I SAM-dependent methyltransferase [Nevskiaceae bacterium]